MKYIYSLFLIINVSCVTKTTHILVSNTGQTQGTFYHIQYISEGGENYKSQIDNLLHLVDNSLSTWKENSLISRINRGEKVKVDKMFSDVFYAAEKVYLESDSLFDCSIAPLTNYWGFGPENVSLVVDSFEVSRRLKLVNYSRLKIINDSLLLPIGMQLDYNSIAQGYSVDVISDYLFSKGVSDYLVEIGGELTARGVNPDGEYWTIGIKKPQEEMDISDRFQFIISLENTSLATSGNYRKFRIDPITGERYVHIINPLTGAALSNNILSASVISDSCIEADAWATSLMVMNPINALDIINEIDGIEILLLTSKNDEIFEIKSNGWDLVTQ